ncbi:hypothetical protein [Paraburkholderia graminis]
MMIIDEPQCRQTKVGGISTVDTTLALRPTLLSTSGAISPEVSK